MKFLLVIFLLFASVEAQHFEWDGNAYLVSSYHDDEVLIHMGGSIPAYLDLLQLFFLKNYGSSFYNFGRERVSANFSIEDSALYLKEIYAACVVDLGEYLPKSAGAPP